MDLADIKDVSIFSKQIGSRFCIEIEPDRFVSAELIEAAALDNGPRSPDLPQREPFSLLFEIEGGIDLPQRTYLVHHETLGEQPLFLVPVGTGRLESVFN